MDEWNVWKMGLRSENIQIKPFLTFLLFYGVIENGRSPFLSGVLASSVKLSSHAKRILSEVAGLSSLKNPERLFSSLQKQQSKPST
jgi:hypothetical protein